MAEDEDKWNLDEENLKKLTSGLLEYDEGVVFDYNYLLNRSMIKLRNYRLKTPKELKQTVYLIKNDLKKYNNEKKINSITTVHELQEFLFSVNLRKLRKVAESYVKIMDIEIKEGYHRNYFDDIKQIFVHHDTEELIETYERKIEEGRRKEGRRKQRRIESQEKIIDEVFNPMHYPYVKAGRRSTQKRKKTIRKKRKNKKRTRRFR